MDSELERGDGTGTSPASVLAVVEGMAFAGGGVVPAVERDAAESVAGVVGAICAWDRDKGGYQHLAKGGAPILDWASNETVDFSTAPNLGVDASKTAMSMSLSAPR